MLSYGDVFQQFMVATSLFRTETIKRKGMYFIIQLINEDLWLKGREYIEREGEKKREIEKGKERERERDREKTERDTQPKPE